MHKESLPVVDAVTSVVALQNGMLRVIIGFLRNLPFIIVLSTT
jgi:hypothetical protein